MSDDQRYKTAMASIKMCQHGGYLDLESDDYEFLTQPNLWIATDRARARRAVEAAVYGSLDFLGLPRFAVPAEFIAGAIAYFVHPSNYLYACTIMDGAEWSENIIQGLERPVRAQELLAHTLRICTGDCTSIDREVARAKLQFGTVDTQNGET